MRQTDAADDDSQHIVEVVRDAARELADRLHLLHLPHLLLSSFSFSDRMRERGVRARELLRGAA